MAATNQITLTVGGSSITITPSSITLSAGGSTVVVDANVFAHSSRDASLMLDANGFIKSSGGAKSARRPQCLPPIERRSRLLLDGDANLTSNGAVGLSGATLSGKGKTEAGLDGGGSTVALTPASADLAGALVNVNGKGVVSIGGPMVKIG